MATAPTASPNLVGQTVSTAKFAPAPVSTPNAGTSGQQTQSVGFNNVAYTPPTQGVSTSAVNNTAANPNEQNSYAVVTSAPATANYNSMQQDYQTNIAPKMQNAAAASPTTNLPQIAGSNVSATPTGALGEKPVVQGGQTYYATPQQVAPSADDVKGMLSSDDTSNSSTPSDTAAANTGTNPTTENSNYQSNVSGVNDEMSDAYNTFRNTIAGITSGAFPLSPAQQSLVDATNLAFNQMATQSQLKSAALSSETGGISSKINATAGELINITAEQSAAVAKLELGFQTQNYQQVTDAYNEYKDLETQKLGSLKDMHESVMSTYNAAVTAAQNVQDEKDKQAQQAEQDKKDAADIQAQKDTENINKADLAIKQSTFNATYGAFMNPDGNISTDVDPKNIPGYTSLSNGMSAINSDNLPDGLKTRSNIGGIPVLSAATIGTVQEASGLNSLLQLARSQYDNIQSNKGELTLKYGDPNDSPEVQNYLQTQASLNSSLKSIGAKYSQFSSLNNLSINNSIDSFNNPSIGFNAVQNAINGGIKSLVPNSNPPPYGQIFSNPTDAQSYFNSTGQTSEYQSEVSKANSLAQKEFGREANDGEVLQGLNTSTGTVASSPKFDPGGMTMQSLPPKISSPASNNQQSDYGSEVEKNLGDTFSQGGENVMNDIKNEPNLAKDAYGSNTIGGNAVDQTLALGSTAGHVAGDIAGTAGGIIGSFITPMLPDSVKSGLGDATKYISDKVNSIPGMTPEIAKSLGDVFSTLTLKGGESAEPLVTTAVKDTADAAASKVSEMLPSLPDASEKAVASPADTLSSRIKDATPNYSDKMNLTNVRTPDTVDGQGNIVKGKVAPRIAGEGKGTFGARPVTTSAAEHATGTELNNIKDYPDNGTALEKGLAVQKAISSEAEGMRSGLQEEDKANPLDSNAEKSKVLNLVKSNLPDEIKNKLGVLSPEDETFMKGMQNKLGAPMPKDGKFTLEGDNITTKLPKTAAGKYYQSLSDAIKDYDGTREGKLDLRQKIDSAYEGARGKLAWGSDSQNELDETHSDIRSALNKDLAGSTKDVDIQSSLKKQSSLYHGLDTLRDKAQQESSTAFGRLEQKYPSLKSTINIAKRQGIYLPLRIAEGAVGVTAASALLKKAISGK